MMVICGHFVHRVTSFEIVPGNQTSNFELGQNTINRRQANVFVFAYQGLVDIFSTQVVNFGTFEDLQYFNSRQGDLEARFFDFFSFGCHGLQGESNIDYALSRFSLTIGSSIPT